MRGKPLPSVFRIEASPDLTRLLADFETFKPELLDLMRLEIRRQNSLLSEQLARKFQDPQARIVYRYLVAREQRLAAILADNRLLWEGVNVPSR